MFTKKLLLLALCVSLPATTWANEASDLLNPDFVKKFLPAEYHSSVESTIGALKGVIGSNGGSTPAPVPAPVPSAPVYPTGSNGLGGSISTQTPLPSISMPPGQSRYTPPNVPAATGGSFNPYMPSAAPTAHATQNIPLPTAAVQNTPAPVAVPNVVPSAGPVNPFTNQGAVQTNQQPRNIVLKADLNANPVFHPPMESRVPEYPPIEGQHWYQYVLVDESVNPL